MISAITPWLDHPELIADYETAMQGAQVIVIDNASKPDNAALISNMVRRLNGIYIRNETNEWFAKANNQGLELSTHSVVMFVNNDIVAPTGWIKQVEREASRFDTLIGPSVAVKAIADQDVAYIEGWCIAGLRETFDRLKGWDAEAYPLPYYEDVDLCFRASQLGIRLLRSYWPVEHKRSVTSGSTPGALDGNAANQAMLESRVRNAR